MKQSRILVLFLVVSLLAASLAACTPTAAPQAEPAKTEAAAEPAAPAAKTYPERDITLIIQSSPGGGSDLFARTFANTVTNKKLLPVVVVPENRSGASGAVAYAYVSEQKGDPYFILNASGTFITTPILGQGEDAGKVNYKNFTPVASLAMDEFVIAVAADSPFKTLQDVVDKGKAEADGVLAAGTEFGSPDSICYHMIEKATGANFNYLVFDGGDEVNAALLGGNADVAIGNPGDFMDLYQANKIRLIGSFSEERLPSLPDVPTVKEQGIDAVYELTRGFVLPADVPDEAVEVLQKTIQEYMKTDEWKEYITTNSLTEKYMSGDEFLKFLEESTVTHTEILTEMEVIK